MHLYPVAKARMSTASSLAPTEARQAPIETMDYWQSWSEVGHRVRSSCFGCPGCTAGFALVPVWSVATVPGANAWWESAAIQARRWEHANLKCTSSAPGQLQDHRLGPSWAYFSTTTAHFVEKNWVAGIAAPFGSYWRHCRPCRTFVSPKTWPLCRGWATPCWRTSAQSGQDSPSICWPKVSCGQSRVA